MFNLNFKYLIAIIILQGILFSESYNIVGTVLDLDTKEPISDGTIFLKKYEHDYTNQIFVNFYFMNLIIYTFDLAF